MPSYSDHRRTLARRRGFLKPAPVRTQPTANPHLSRYGLQLERRAVDVFTHAAVPEWWLSIRRSDREDDLAGVDAWVETDRGTVPVQIKSSAARALEWRAKHPGIDAALVVLRADMTDDEIVRVVVANVAVVRERMLKAA